MVDSISMKWNLANKFIIFYTEKKAEGIYTNARKQLLISAVPVILILHLKRFHQVKVPFVALE